MSQLQDANSSTLVRLDRSSRAQRQIMFWRLLAAECLKGEEKMKRPLRAFLFGLLLMPGWLLPVHAQQAPNHALVILIPGIRDAASNEWVGTGSLLLSTKERYALVLNGAKPSKSLSSIPPDHVITLSDTDPQAWKAKVQAIAKKESATVVVDMPLEGITDWPRQTKFAGDITAMLGTVHKDSYSDSYNLLIAHSAGTEAAANAQAKAASTAQSATKSDVFDSTIAASPRCQTCSFAPNTLIITANGDFLASPGGHVLPGTLAGGVAGEAEAKGWAAQGNYVLRISDPAGSLNTTEIAKQMAEKLLAVGKLPAVGKLDPVTGVRAAIMVDQVQAHTATIDLSYPDRTIWLYRPGSAEPEKLAGTSLAKVIEAVQKEQIARTTNEQIIAKETLKRPNQSSPASVASPRQSVASVQNSYPSTLTPEEQAARRRNEAIVATETLGAGDAPAFDPLKLSRAETEARRRNEAIVARETLGAGDAPAFDPLKLSRAETEARRTNEAIVARETLGAGDAPAFKPSNLSPAASIQQWSEQTFPEIHGPSEMGSISWGSPQPDKPSPFSDGLTARNDVSANLDVWNGHDRYVKSTWSVKIGDKVIGSNFTDVVFLGGGRFAAKSGPTSDASSFYTIFDNNGHDVGNGPFFEHHFQNIQPLGDGYFATRDGLGRTNIVDPNANVVVHSIDANTLQYLGNGTIKYTDTMGKAQQVTLPNFAATPVQPPGSSPAAAAPARAVLAQPSSSARPLPPTGGIDLGGKQVYKDTPGLDAQFDKALGEAEVVPRRKKQ